MGRQLPQLDTPISPHRHNPAVPAAVTCFGEGWVGAAGLQPGQGVYCCCVGLPARQLAGCCNVYQHAAAILTARHHLQHTTKHQRALALDCSSPGLPVISIQLDSQPKCEPSCVHLPSTTTKRHPATRETHPIPTHPAAGSTSVPTCCSGCVLASCWLLLPGAAARQTTLLPQPSVSTVYLAPVLASTRGHSSSRPPASPNTTAAPSLRAAAQGFRGLWGRQAVSVRQ